MTKPLTKALLGGAASIAIAAFTFMPSAHAACWWNGYNWSCNTPPAYSYTAAPGWGPAAYAPYSNGYGYAYNAPFYGYGPHGRYPGPKTN